MSNEAPRRRYVPVIGPRLKYLLWIVFGLFALLGVNSVYMASVTFAGWVSGASYENYFYLWMVLVHLGLGLLITVPVIAFGIGHIRNARNRPNRRAVRAGYALFVVSILLLVTGYVLLRLDGFIVVNNQTVRTIAYWMHVISPLAAVWLFVLHRLAGRRIKWKVGVSWAAVAAVFALAMLGLQAMDPRQWNVAGNPSGDEYFQPSLARTVSGDFIPEHVLDNDEYCIECHADVHAAWSNSVHRFSSFNNPPYVFSVQETRRAMYERDGDVQGSRFCAACHDPVVLFSGAFDDPKYDDPDFDLASDPAGNAGITCTSCHAISHVNSPRGNGDYTIDEPLHYPFTFSENRALRWVNHQLVKAKPAFHKKTFLKPLHKTTEFCGTCHKVHLPVALNDYKWLRGQNHHDSFWLSGVSGHSVSSFYYPPVAQPNCNECHMPPVLAGADSFGGRILDDSGQLKVHDHTFPGANTAMPILADMPDPERAIAAHRKILEDCARVDIFGLRAGNRVDAPLTAPLRPDVPAIVPGETYLVDVVIRTLTLGHLLTQGTADSNELWLDVTVRSGDRIIGRSGDLDPQTKAVDPWAHYVNSFVLDREGRRINRRNPQDIFTALYNNQIPPGAADVVHYRLAPPADITEPVTIDVALRYRKFDQEYMSLVYDDPDLVNELPIVTIAADSVTFPVASQPAEDLENATPLIPEWQRWNDYGIGLFRKERLGELRQAEEAFRQVEALGRPEGAINLARVFLKNGQVAQAAPDALRRAAEFEPPPYEWQLLWFSALVDKQNGRLDEAIRKFEQIVEGGFAQAAGRNFNFANDYRLLNELGDTVYERAKQERGAARRTTRTELLQTAADWFHQTLRLDPENLAAHYGLRQIYVDLGTLDDAEHHASEHERYKPDENARDVAVAAARSIYPAADRAAEAVVIYDLHRDRTSAGASAAREPDRSAPISLRKPDAPAAPSLETP